MITHAAKRVAHSRSIGLVVVLLFVFVTSVNMSCVDDEEAANPPGWQAVADSYLEGYFEFNPTSAVYAGRHEFDGRLPDWTDTGLRQYVAWLKAQRARVREFDVAALDERQRFERDYVLASIEGELFSRDRLRTPNKSPLFYSGALSPSVYATRQYAPADVRLRAFSKYAREVRNALSQMKQNLELPLPRTYVETASMVFGGLASYFEDDLPSIFAEVEDEGVLEEFRSANAEAVEALHETVTWLEEQKADATEDFALGPELFLEMLRAEEGVDITLSDLKAAGERDLERNLSSLREACDVYAPGETLSECVDKAQASKPEGGAVEGAKRQLDGLRTFLVEHDLVTIPGTEKAGVAEAPPYARWNFAYIDIPGPYEKGLPSTYYIAPPDPSWSEEDRLAYIPGKADLLFVSVHEVWPGHFLHYLHVNRNESRIARNMHGYAFSEGWAHYTEEMMWDAGLGDGDPETHIGQLINALIRNVRYLSAIGLHTEGMTVEESERMFLEKAFQDAGNARQQAVRGTFDPGYLNYTLGKLMITKLREDWTASRGGREAWGQFHDAFLSHGAPPIPLVRRAMLDGDTAVDGPILPGP